MRILSFATALAFFWTVPNEGRAADGLGVARPVVVPQVGVLQKTGTPPLALKRVTAGVEVRGNAATTQLDVQLTVNGKSPAVCDVLIPLPPNAKLLSVRPPADGAVKERAGFERQSGIVAKTTLRRLAVDLNDPAVLEFYGSNIVLLRSLTLSAGDDPVVTVRYRESAKTPGSVGRCLLPRSERLHYGTPWEISASIEPVKPVNALYCPSHPVVTNSTNGTVTAKVQGNATAEPGPFRLFWSSTDTAGIAGMVLAYPPRDGDDGYFLWLLQAPETASRPNPVKREITLVVDRSASMDGKRIREVREAANGVLGKLQPGDSFNIVTFNQGIDAYAKSPVNNTAANVAAAKTFLKNVQPRGGSNIHGALKTSLAQPAANGRLPIVLFFTDGLPTSGSPSEVKIRNLALKENPHRRRIYTVGIGVDLLSPLLNGLSAASGGRSTFVLPNEDVAKKVAPVIDRLQKPVLTDAKVSLQTADGKDAALVGAAASQPSKDARQSFRHVMPSEIPDLFAGDQVVVLGRYRGTGPRSLAVTGNYLGTTRSFRFPFDPKSASTAHAFLRRLWASRRIGQLVESIRQEGAKAPAPYAVRKQTPAPQLAARSKEVLQLTARYGVLTEYTAFLSRGEQSAADQSFAYSQLLKNLDDRAVRSRSGTGSVNQETNSTIQNGQVRLNSRNRFWNARMDCVNVGTVQQIGTLALFRRGNRWVDGRLLIAATSFPSWSLGTRGDLKKSPNAAKTIAFGSPSYWTLLDELSSEGRQGALALGGDLLLLRHGKPLLVTGPKQTPPEDLKARR
jgi:Ca-activated chloride channel family protein